MDRARLLACVRAPFDTGPDTLVTSYSIVAELSCFQALSWPMPRNVLCTYFETAAATNGLDLVGLTNKRPSLLEACDMFGIPARMTAERKTYMRDLILGNADYTEAQWGEIESYNRERRAAQHAVVRSAGAQHRPPGGTVAWPLRQTGGRHGAQWHSD
jgi:hypothetical protein